MRRIAVLSLLVLAVSAVFASSAMAINSPQKLEASATPTAGGTKKKPVGVSLHIRPFIPDISADLPFATTKALVYFPKELVINARYFKYCTRAKVQKNEKKCPPASKIGSGIAAGLALGLTENLTVDVFNGPGGNKVELLVKGASPLVIREVIEAKLQKVKGTYGWRLTVPIPTGLQTPVDGVYATLTDFDVTLDKKTVKKGKKTYAWAALTGCTGSLKFGYQGQYTDGTKQDVAIEQAC
ncbi:unannotated protein [freshwater metagenome]|uniref:Unannotated protein n=1 Tax=freshwater metagenome TaxID=449393 RepID=A0A6J7IPA6_9ZZZZ|nr:hypothetical protein [Actinomycetota bacterium]